MASNTVKAAAEIRAALKAKGWSSREVSVRSESFSMGSAIRVEIKSADVPSAVVEAIAKGHERIDRCSITQEILSGCNRYITVSYAWQTQRELAERFIGPVEKALADLPAGDTSRLIPVEGTDLLVGRDGFSGLSLWGGGRFRSSYGDAKGLAAGVAVAVLNGGAQ
jgi:hypothetical protein